MSYLDPRNSSFECLTQFRMFYDRRVPESSAELQEAPGSSGKLRRAQVWSTYFQEPLTSGTSLTKRR
eukprot:14223588-Alexandrium_andersonii.AAC.1